MCVHVMLQYFNGSGDTWAINTDTSDLSATSFYPTPQPYGTVPTTTTPFLQIFEWFWTGGNPVFSNGANGVPFMDIEVTESMPAPSFVSGAAITLKANRLTIGIIGLPALTDTACTSATSC